MSRGYTCDISWEIYAQFGIIAAPPRVSSPSNSQSGKKGCGRKPAHAISKLRRGELTGSRGLELASLGLRASAICPGNLLAGAL